MSIKTRGTNLEGSLGSVGEIKPVVPFCGTWTSSGWRSRQAGGRRVEQGAHLGRGDCQDSRNQPGKLFRISELNLYFDIWSQSRRAWQLRPGAVAGRLWSG